MPNDIADLVDTAGETFDDLAGPYVLLTSASRSISGIIPNVTIRETLVDENTVTVHPVQSGAPVSDHVYANPNVVEMVVAWSDSSGGYPGYVQDVYQALLALRDTRGPFDLSTGKRQYSNMLFKNITVSTDQTSEYALFATVQLQEVIIANTQTGSVENVGYKTLEPVTTPMPTIDGGYSGIAVSSSGSGGIGAA